MSEGIQLVPSNCTALSVPFKFAGGTNSDPSEPVNDQANQYVPGVRVVGKVEGQFTLAYMTGLVALVKVVVVTRSVFVHPVVKPVPATGPAMIVPAPPGVPFHNVITGIPVRVLVGGKV
jgi:hypothetical protein